MKTFLDVTSWKLMHTLLRSVQNNTVLMHYLIYFSLYSLTPLSKYWSVY